MHAAVALIGIPGREEADLGRIAVAQELRRMVIVRLQRLGDSGLEDLRGPICCQSPICRGNWVKPSRGGIVTSRWGRAIQPKASTAVSRAPPISAVEGRRDAAA
ncbi:hypothetical protein ACFSZS_31350 [Seohaeicola zhoushanensis]